MKRSIFGHTFLIGIITLAVCLVVTSILLYQESSRNAWKCLATEAACISQGIERDGTGYFEGFTTEDSILWLGADGTVLYRNTEEETAAAEEYLSDEAVQEAMENGSGTGRSQNGTVRILSYAELLDDGTVLRLSTEWNDASSIAWQVTWPALLVIAMIVVAAALLSYRLATRITISLSQIDPQNPKSDVRYEELQPLVEHLHSQNMKIRQQMQELTRQQEEFTAITDRMNEGLLLVDAKGNILSSNRSAMRLLTGDEDSSVANLRREPCRKEICEGAETALAGVKTEKLLPYGGRTYQMTAYPVVSNGQVSGAVVIFYDVTEREQGEAMRREFTANVSHELKTPLTSISGFAELMQQGLVPQEKVADFAGDIYREAQRLINLVDDILDLSKLEEKTQLPEQESVDLYDLSEEVLENLRPIAAKRQIRLALEGTHVTVSGIRPVLTEMIYNLCDNAVKYNRDGGSVTVTVGQEAGQKIVSVADTGVGIPYADQDRVFERFYRVDKSHSREIGGTGLGLSIVKHGAQLHNARLELKSKPDVGTTVRIIF